MIIALLLCCASCKDDHRGGKRDKYSAGDTDSVIINEDDYSYLSVYSLLVLPKNPQPGGEFRILATGGAGMRKARIIVNGPSGSLKSVKIKTGMDIPCWRIEDYAGSPEGNYRAILVTGRKELCNLEFSISQGKMLPKTGVVWKTVRGWDTIMETTYSAWVNALFYDCNEQVSWPALHEVTQDKERNFLYNYLSLGEDERDGKIRVLMQPDCADNPFFLRAYFAWKLGLPFGYHICDRGGLGRNPGTGKWITNETPTSKTHPVLAFNAFLRKIMDGVHSGTARTALNDGTSDYYPVALERKTILPGIVYADPYGHTMIIVRWIPQTGKNPGILLSVDAQPDGTVAIKRFWKGNFLFNTAEVVGEPGFKAFRPIVVNDGVAYPMQNNALTSSSGFIPFSLEQRKMEADVFYNTMGRIINPEPLDPEAALVDLIKSLHEQLLVRVTSVANSENYFKSHPGTVIDMPSGTSGIFLAGGLWEAYSTPNRDLRLLIAMDAVLEFPEVVARAPENFSLQGKDTPQQIREQLQSLLDDETTRLSISYTRSDGSTQELTLAEVLNRRNAFEVAYNPNDGIEIRWGAPQNSNEIATCRRQAPAYQRERMQQVRSWFSKRLHPPT